MKIARYPQTRRPWAEGPLDGCHLDRATGEMHAFTRDGAGRLVCVTFTPAELHRLRAMLCQDITPERNAA